MGLSAPVPAPEDRLAGLPGDFGGLELPVATPNHTLSKAAVDAADARLDQVSGLTADVESRARTRTSNLQAEAFGELGGPLNPTACERASPFLRPVASVQP